jgi:hypothetical protein
MVWHACLDMDVGGKQFSATDENATPKKRLRAELAPGDHRAPMALSWSRQTEVQHHSHSTAFRDFGRLMTSPLSSPSVSEHQRPSKVKSLHALELSQLLHEIESCRWWTALVQERFARSVYAAALSSTVLSKRADSDDEVALHRRPRVALPQPRSTRAHTQLCKLSLFLQEKGKRAPHCKFRFWSSFNHQAPPEGLLCR